MNTLQISEKQVVELRNTLPGHKKVGVKGGGGLKMMSLKPPEPVKVKPNKIKKPSPSQNVVTRSDIGRMWKKKGVEIPPKNQRQDSALSGERTQATWNNSKYAYSDRKSTPRHRVERKVLPLVDGEQRGGGFWEISTLSKRKTC